MYRNVGERALNKDQLRNKCSEQILLTELKLEVCLCTVFGLLLPKDNCLVIQNTESCTLFS